MTNDTNTGFYNTGNYNTGFRNTGNYNTGNYHVGCFNTINPEKAYYFNKLIDKAVWYAAAKPDWIYKPRAARWIPLKKMTDGEKVSHPSYGKAGGYFRVNDMKEEWRKAYESASPAEIQAVRDLPAFDYDVFEEITGLDLRKAKGGNDE